MRRRDFIKVITGTATAWPLAAYAQRAARKVQRIGIIDDSSNWDPFRQQLRELNYVEGENLTYVYLRTDGSPAQLDAAASALAQIPVNVIIAFGTPRAQAAQRATKTIPIVAISIGDPICRRPGNELGASWRQHHRKHHSRPGRCHQETANPERCDSRCYAGRLPLESGQPGHCRHFRAFT